MPSQNEIVLLTDESGSDEHAKTRKTLKMSNLTIKSINKKYQVTVNRFLKWDAKYEAIVNENDILEGDGKLTEARENKQAAAYDKASIYFDELPKREQKNLGKLAFGY